MSVQPSFQQISISYPCPTNSC